ncbi:MAG: J domain-containing protein [Alkalinema sp. RU_4_3]|nr:J domain-containing protein [Alkalinema sp. RU_4_3]
MAVKLSIHDSYTVLDLAPGCSIDELKLAYKDMVQVWHPDRFTHNPRLGQKAEDKLKQINLAYETLEAAIAQRQAMELARNVAKDVEQRVARKTAQTRFDPIPANQTAKLRLGFALWTLVLVASPWLVFLFFYWVTQNPVLVGGAAMIAGVYFLLRFLSERG